MKIKNRDVQPLLDALNALAVKDNGKPLYVFSGATRIALAQIQRGLKAANEDLSTAITALAESHGVDKLGSKAIAALTPEELASYKTFRLEESDTLKAEISIAGEPIKQADLDLEKNNIGFDVLAGLAPILSV